MKYRRLGNSGLEVSAVGLGGNNFGSRSDAASTAEIVAAALDAGINFIDTADVYGGGQSEAFLGRALQGRRQEVLLATKFGFPMDDGIPTQARGSRRYILSAVESSLRRLQTDYIDLYQMHVPDPATPLDETLRALDDLVSAGKIRYIGHSNYAAWQTTNAHYIANQQALTPFVSGQNRYNLLDRRVEVDLIPAMEQIGVSLIPWSPLGGGFLTGKYRRDQPLPPGARLTEGSPSQRLLNDRNFAMAEALETFAESRGHTLLELALSWLVSRPFIGSVIAGATGPDQVIANVAAAEWSMTPDEIAEVDQITAR